jgi:hypothetical protein
MFNSGRLRRLWDAYRFPSFRPDPVVVGVFGDPMARIIRLHRREKKRAAARAGWHIEVRTTTRLTESAICLAETGASTWCWNSAGWTAGAAAK